MIALPSAFLKRRAISYSLVRILKRILSPISPRVRLRPGRRPHHRPRARRRPRGALQARIAQAPFPFLSTNLRRSADDTHPPIGLPSIVLARAGVQIGVIGVTTEATPHTTIAANFAGLAVAPLAATIADEARSMRARGATIVVVAAHAGGRCTDFAAPDDLATCNETQELMTVARALPPGAVDVMVAGHTHQAMAHRVDGVAIVQGRTTFIIAHRLATLHDVDRIIVVERGTIVEEGDHEALRNGAGCMRGCMRPSLKFNTMLKKSASIVLAS